MKTFTLSALMMAISHVSATYTYIAGYEPQSDVMQHNRIDLDLEEIMSTHLPGNTGVLLSSCTGQECNWGGNTDNLTAPTVGSGNCGGDTQLGDCNTAYDIYRYGKYSNKSTTLRSLYAMGTKTKSSGNDASVDVDMVDNPAVSVMNSYWNSKLGTTNVWATDILEAAFQGTTIGDLNMATVGWDFRREIIQKGILYLNVFPYIIWEMQDAINDCKFGRITANDDASVHAWDEAVAFYTGSLEGAAQYGDSSNGKLLHALADKRCQNFRTCTADYDNDPQVGYSVINHDVFEMFTVGKDQIKGAYISTAADKCDIVTPTMNRISSAILNMFVQGTQRYLWKTRQTQSAKQAGEFTIFASAILPFVHQVDSACAEKLYNRAWRLDYTTDSWEDIKMCLENTYPNLGVAEGLGEVKCSRIGTLDEATSWTACEDPSTSSSSSDYEGVAVGLGVALGLLVLICAVVNVYMYLRMQRDAESAKVMQAKAVAMA